MSDGPRTFALLTVLALLLVACSVNTPTPGMTPGTPTASSTTAGSPAPTGGAPGSGAPGTGVDAEQVGRAFIGALDRGDDATATSMLDATMLAALPGTRLHDIWAQLTAQLGEFVAIDSAQVTTQGAFEIVAIQARFASSTVTLQVTVDGDAKVAGFFVRPAAGRSPAPSGGQPGSPAPSIPPASYVDQSRFTETDITVGTAPWALPGTLSMPVGAGPFPGVVLVAGSGPEDRDETIGPNKPLRDIAWGLASHGIAVLRYDKRTLTYGAAMAAQVDSVTVREETIDDAVAAITLLRATAGVDPARVFMAGHSLGGYLAPRIAAAATAPGLRGIVYLAANSRPLPTLILEQSRYLASLDASPSPEVQVQLDRLAQQVALAESPELSPTTPRTDLPLNVPASYWLDLQTYDPLSTAAGLRVPMLFCQGDRDYQVTRTDLAGWRGALGSRSDVTFREYAALDHLFLAGSGPSRPAEYAVPGHVALDLVNDIVAWIRAQ